MANERYRICTTAGIIAERNLGRPSFIFVSPSDQGKTDTVRMLLRDIKTAYAIPPSSPTELGDWLNDRADISTLLILDDPSDWYSKDFASALSFMKGLQTGVIRSPRSTRFNISVPVRDNIATVLFCNQRQFDSIRIMADSIGFLPRAILIYSKHDPETRLDISDFYREHNITNDKPPRLKTNMRFEYKTNTNNANLDEFKGSQRETAEIYCRILPESDFTEMIPFFRSGLRRQYVDEKIEFEVV
jgi:hypothetical protein